jgi:iron complex transport system substrate-binding protein
VALEYEYAEILSSLGVDLVGMSETSQYQQWVGKAVPLRGAPQDVGVRMEPSVEKIAELRPDLIVASARSVSPDVRTQLERIAPVIVLSTEGGRDPLATIAGTVNTLALAAGVPQAGRELNAKLSQTLEANARTVADAGLSGTPAVFALVENEGNSVLFRMHGDGSPIDAVLTAMGFARAWSGAADADGVSYTDVEGLTALPSQTRFLSWTNQRDGDPIQVSLARNAVWQGLPIVTGRHVLPIADGLWPYGGPESMIALSNEITHAVVAP